MFLKKLEDAGIITSPDGHIEDEDIPQFTNDLKKKFEIGKQATDIGIYVKVLRRFIETDLPGLSMERKKFYKLKLAEDLRTVNMQCDQEITPNESKISPKKIAMRDRRSMRQITAGKNMSLKLVLQKKSKNFLPFRPLELNHFQYNNSLHGALGELTMRGGFNTDFENHKSRSRGMNVSNGREGNKNYRKVNTSTNGTGWMNRMGNQFVSPGKSNQKLTKKPERRKREKKTTPPRYNYGHSSSLRKESIGTSEGSRSIRKSKDRERIVGTVIDVHGIQNAKRASYAKKAISKSYTDLTISGPSAIDSPKERDNGVPLKSHIANQNIPTFANLSHGELPPIVEQSLMCDDSQETSKKLWQFSHIPEEENEGHSHLHSIHGGSPDFLKQTTKSTKYYKAGSLNLAVDKSNSSTEIYEYLKEETKGNNFKTDTDFSKFDSEKSIKASGKPAIGISGRSLRISEVKKSKFGSGRQIESSKYQQRPTIREEEGEESIPVSRGNFWHKK